MPMVTHPFVPCLLDLSISTDLSLIFRALCEIGSTALSRDLGVERCQTGSTVLFYEL